MMAAELTLEEDGSEQLSSALSSSAKEEEQKQLPAEGSVLQGEVSMKLEGVQQQQKRELSENALLNDFLKDFIGKGPEVVGQE